MIKSYLTPLLALAAAVMPTASASAACTNVVHCEVNVVDCGASANDGMPDTLAFSDAVQAVTTGTSCSLTGGVVHVPPGRFDIDGLEIVNRLTLAGAAMGRTVLELGPGTDVHAMGASRFRLASFTVEGAIDLEDVTDFEIDSVEVTGATGAGLAIRGDSQRGLLSNVVAHLNGGDGVALELGESAEHLRVSGSQAYDNSRHGFRVDGGSGVTFTACVAMDNEGQGFHAHGVSQSAWAGCVARRNTGHGFGVSASGSLAQDLTFSSCVAQANKQYGLRFESAIRVVVTGIASHGNTLDGLGFVSVSAAERSRQLSVAGGSITGNLRHGISVRGATDVTLNGLTVMNNSAPEAGRHGILLTEGEDSDPEDLKAERILITGNTIGDNQAAFGDVTTQEDGVRANLLSDHVYLFSNHFFGNNGDAVDVNANVANACWEQNVGAIDQPCP